MTISASATVDDIIFTAYDLCERGTKKMGTGYLLLAILNGNGPASKTLTLRKLSATQVRTAIRELEEESEHVISRVRKKAFEYAQSLKIETPSGIHLLAAIATVTECQGYKILKKAGLNTDTIRFQALKNMTTSMTREHSGGISSQNRCVS